MLIGNYQAKLDAEKGRTALPKKFRSQLGKKVIITAGFENSLMLVSANAWQKVVGSVVNKPFVEGAARKTDRFLLGSAFEANLDSQGRFIIPKTLRNYATLSENIVFVGIGNRVEIWDQEKWDEHQLYLDDNIERIAETINDEKSS